MSLPQSVYDVLGPSYGPPIPPQMLDPYGIQSLYQAPGNPISPSILAGTNAPSAVESLYAASGGGGGGASALSRLAGQGAPGILQEAGGFSGKAALRAAWPAFAGFTAAGLANQYSPLKPGSAPQSALEGALKGAGVGGSIGLLGGPFEPISVPLGIVGGGIVGGGLAAVSNYFGGGDSGPSFGKDAAADRVTELDSLMVEAGLSPNERAQMRNAFNVNWKVAPDDASRQQIYAQAQQQVASYAANQIGAPTQLTPEQILATQALAASVMKPYTDQIQAQGALSEQVFGNLADQATDPNVALLARTMGQGRAEGASKLAAAYEQQALMLPSLNALQLANQYGQQAFAAANRPTSSGASSIQALIQQASAGGLGATGYSP